MAFGHKPAFLCLVFGPQKSYFSLTFVLGKEVPGRYVLDAKQPFYRVMVMVKHKPHRKMDSWLVQGRAPV